MTKSQYKKARRLVRDNGNYALNWLPCREASEMEALLNRSVAADPLAVRADIIDWCKREGLSCNVRHTGFRYGNEK